MLKINAIKMASKLVCIPVLVCAAHACVSAAESMSQSTTLARLGDAAQRSDWAMERLADLTDLIGPRPVGSAAAQAAVEQVAAAMRKLGLKVTLQPVKVPHWVRGHESAEIFDHAGAPAGLRQKIVLTALGGSAPTPAAGITANVLVVHSFRELEARSAEARGAIVVFDVAFDQALAKSGNAVAAYMDDVEYRVVGPAKAAELGAVAALVRSVGGANFRLPHAGFTFMSDQARIPAAAISAEDAMLFSRLATRGPMKLHLILASHAVEQVDSFNVIADLPGTDQAGEVLIVSGHLDSWDLGTGANDDATGVVASMAALETMVRLHLHPRRTIRLVAWMSEEFGGQGGKAYFNALHGDLSHQFAAIENDLGSGRPLGIVAGAAGASAPRFEPLRQSLKAIDAGLLSFAEVPTGDMGDMQAGGVPIFSPMIDSRNYFDYHHTAADTFDKVNPDDLKRHVAVTAELAWFLANLDGQIASSTEKKVSE